MSYHAGDFLASLYGDRPATSPDTPGPEPQATAPRQPQEPARTTVADAPTLGPTDTPGDHDNGLQPQGEPSGDTPAADADGGPLGGLDFSGWVLRPDALGRLGLEPGDLPEADRWWTRGGFDELPEPGDGCPACGSLEVWLDLTGGRHCGRCEADKLARSLQLAERAARLRRQTLGVG